MGRLGGVTGTVGVLCLVASALAPSEPGGGWFSEAASAGVALMLLGLVAIYLHARPVFPAWAGLGLMLAWAGIASFLVVVPLFAGVNLYIWWLAVALMLLGPVMIYIHARPALPVWAGLGLALAPVGIVAFLWTLNIFWTGDGDLWLVPVGATMVGISVFLAGLHRSGVIPLWAPGMLVGAQVVGILAYEAPGPASRLLAWTALTLAAAGWAWTAAVVWNAPRSRGSAAMRGAALQ